jgi:glutamate/tyrosine decarboxylase-like PLP-dependent enzyme
MSEALIASADTIALRAAVEAETTKKLADALQHIAAGPVTPTIDPVSFHDELSGFDFHAPRSLSSVVDWVVGVMSRGNVQMTHPRYLGLFNPAPALAAEQADRITAALNPQLAVWSHAPVAADIEQHVIRAFSERLGLGASSAGHFTSGGAESNLSSVLCALSRAFPVIGDQGLRSLSAQPTVYVSADSHLAWIKIACMVGIGRNAVRLVATDGLGRMDPAALALAIDTDRRQGFAPFMVGATAGTTNAGMVDPLHACADLASAEGLWLHVDAAWGGALIASPTLRRELAGIERADSVTIDAHKWFAATMGTGMYFVREGTLLNRVFAVSTSYMPSNDATRDPYITSALWSRRMLGLRLFLPLAQVGWPGYAQHVERAVDLAAVLRDDLVGRGWRTVNASAMAVLCVRPPDGSAVVKDIVARVVHAGNTWCSVARFEGQDVVRLCITNGASTKHDMRLVGDALHRACEDSGHSHETAS